jgi:hypothetical protein
MRFDDAMNGIGGNADEFAWSEFGECCESEGRVARCGALRPAMDGWAGA